MNDVIYSYTLEDAINDGQIAEIRKETPNISGLFATTGVMAQQGIGFKSKEDDYLFLKTLIDRWEAEFKIQPEQDTTGGNDQDFFTFFHRDVRYFSCRNEKGFTIILPEEY